LKGQRRRTTGTGRTRHLKDVISRIKVYKSANLVYAAKVASAKKAALKKANW
jgi:hypothetical protein